MTIENDILTGKISIDGQILPEPLQSLAKEYLNIQSEVNALTNTMNQKFAELEKAFNAEHGIVIVNKIDGAKDIYEDTLITDAEEIPHGFHNLLSTETNLQMIERNIDLQKQFKSFNKVNSQD